MVSAERQLPQDFSVGSPSKDGALAGLDTARNIKWAARLGARTNGSPVVARGRAFIGTNSAEGSYRPATRLAGGWFQCLDERSGRLLWQLVIPKLPESKAPHSDTNYGVCSTPAVDGDRVYLVTNLGDVLCLDIEGQANGNDGPFTAEAEYLTWRNESNRPEGPPHTLDANDGDILWRFDMVTDLKCHPHDASSCSPLLHGDYLYVCTGNGVNRGEKKVEEPNAPSLIVLDKSTGRLAATDDEYIGRKLYKGQWSSPALSLAGGKPRIIYGAGDGKCYAFEPLAGADPNGQVGKLKKLWAVECNPPQCLTKEDGQPVSYYDQRNGPSEIVGTPACVGDRVYVTVGRDPHHGKGPGRVTCIDAAAGGVIWTYDKIGRSISTVSVHDGLVYVAETFGFLHCLSADTGEPVWKYDTKGVTWGSTMVADGKVYLPTTRGLMIFAAGREGKLLATVPLGTAGYSTPCAANGVLYVASQRYLYAVREGATPPVTTAPTSQPAP